MEQDIAIINIKNLKERMNREYRKEFYGYIGDIDIINKTIDTLLEERQQDKEKIKKLEEENTVLKKANNISENVTVKDITNFMNKSLKDFKKEYIPVSLVKEKIEEYTKLLKNCNRFSDVDRIKAINERILAYKELLEKRK